MIHKLALVLSTVPEEHLVRQLNTGDPKITPISKTATSSGVRQYLKDRKLPEFMQHKVSKYVQDVAATPKPVAQPRLSSPSPFAQNLPTAEPLGKTPDVKMHGAGGPRTTETGTKTADNGMGMPLLGAGVGGVGGYYVGKNLIEPLAELKQQALINDMANLQQRLQNWKRVGKYSPATMAVVGAILLATLAAHKARKNERETLARSPFEGMYNSQGFRPSDQINMGQSFY